MSFKKRCEVLVKTSDEVIEKRWNEFCCHHLIIKRFDTKTMDGIGEIFNNKINGNPNLSWQTKEVLKGMRER